MAANYIGCRTLLHNYINYIGRLVCEIKPPFLLFQDDTTAAKAVITASNFTKKTRKKKRALEKAKALANVGITAVYPRCFLLWRLSSLREWITAADWITRKLMYLCIKYVEFDQCKMLEWSTNQNGRKYQKVEDGWGEVECNFETFRSCCSSL